MKTILLLLTTNRLNFLHHVADLQLKQRTLQNNAKDQPIPPGETTWTK
jgi:hypothetical protein